MRGTVAKRLRRMARETAQYYGHPERDTRVVNLHPKRYPWLIKGTTGLDGQFLPTDLGVRMVGQHVNPRNTERGYYLELKRKYRAQFGHR
jgi:hypothetical protein